MESECWSWFGFVGCVWWEAFLEFSAGVYDCGSQWLFQMLKCSSRGRIELVYFGYGISKPDPKSCGITQFGFGWWPCFLWIWHPWHPTFFWIFHSGKKEPGGKYLWMPALSGISKFHVMRALIIPKCETVPHSSEIPLGSRGNESMDAALHVLWFL